MNEENKMREIKIEKLVLNIGGTGEKLEKGFILLGKISNKKPIKIKAVKRIPTWNVRPGLEVGTKVTLRGKDAEKMLIRLLQTINNTLKERQIRDNFVSFGIAEYIEVPGMEYIREVGIMGFEVSIVFARTGKRVERKKIKKGSAKRQLIHSTEIQEYMKKNYKTKIIMKKTKSGGEK